LKTTLQRREDQAALLALYQHLVELEPDHAPWFMELAAAQLALDDVEAARSSLLLVAQDPQVRASRSLGRGPRPRGGPRGPPLADRLGQGDQVVRRYGLALGWVETHDVPAPRGRQAGPVVGTQVIGVRLGEGGQRPQHRRLLGVDVGQGHHSATVTRGPGALSRDRHDTTL